MDNGKCDILFAFDERMIYRDKVHIPKKLLKLHWKKYEYKLQIANPDEHWNDTDLLSPEDNNRQLIFGGNFDKLGFLFLKSGGLGASKTCIIFDLDSEYIEVVGVDPYLSTLDELRTVIAEHLSCK